MTIPIDIWLANHRNPEQDPLPGMRQAGLLDPVPDYVTIARVKAELVQRTGLLGIGGVWSGSQLIGRHFLRGFGTAAQQASWLGRPLSVAISEPKVGAHPKLLLARAEEDGDGFRISGQKAWVSNGHWADAIIVFAITSEEQGRKRYSAFLVPADTPGLSIGEMPGFHALRPSRHWLVTLEDCRLSATAMLGDRGSAYERMALPFRDIEDAVGTFGTLGALRYALSLFADQELPGPEQTADLGAIVALTAVFEAGAEAVVAALDSGRFGNGNATLVGLRVLATDILTRIRPIAVPAAAEVISDLGASLSIAQGPRLARQIRLGEMALGSGHTSR